MKKIHESVLELIETKFDDSQIAGVKYLMEEGSDPYFLNYSILALALGQDLVPMTEEEVLEFYKAEANQIGPVDTLIAQVIKTLEKLSNEDIKKEYETKLVLDRTQPELAFLSERIQSVKTQV